MGTLVYQEQGKANMPLPLDFTTVQSDLVLLWENRFTCFTSFKDVFDMLIKHGGH